MWLRRDWRIGQRGAFRHKRRGGILPRMKRMGRDRIRTAKWQKGTDADQKCGNCVKPQRREDRREIAPHGFRSRREPRADRSTERGNLLKDAESFSGHGFSAEFFEYGSAASFAERAG